MVIFYYQRLIKQLNNNAFVSANEYYKPDDIVNSISDRDAFLAPDFDPWKYCKVTYDLPSFLKDNPHADKYAPKFLL